MPKSRTAANNAPAPAAPRKRTRLDVDARRAQLIARGLEAFSERPYDEVSVDELAEAAGTSKGLLYHYFSGKRGYYVAVLDHAARQLVDETTPVARDLPAPERLRQGLETYFGFVEQHGAAFVALMRGGIGSDPEVAAILERTRQAYAERILEALPPGLDTPLLRTALRGWIGFAEAVAVAWVEKREVTQAELVQLVTMAMLGTVQSASGYALR